MGREKNEEFSFLGTRQLNMSGFVNIGNDDKVAKSLGASDEDLQKGDVANAFKNTYGDKEIKVSKTGKEIKAGLTTKKQTYETKKQIVEDKKIAILATLKGMGCEDLPDEISWRAKDIEDFDTKIFSWKLKDKYSVPYSVKEKLKTMEAVNVEANDIEATNVAAGTANQFDTKEVLKYKKHMKLSSLMDEYNSKVEECVGIHEDLAVINTMLNNIDDKRSYELSIKQLQAAGL